MSDRTTMIDLTGQGLGRFTFAPSGALAYTTRDGSFVLYEAETGAEQSLFLGVELGGFDFTADGEVLAVVLDDPMGSALLRFTPGGNGVERIDVTPPTGSEGSSARDVVIDATGRPVLAHFGREALWAFDEEAGETSFLYEASPVEYGSAGALLSESETGELIVSLNDQDSGADITVYEVANERFYTTNSFDLPLNSFHRYEAAASSLRNTVLVNQSFDLLLVNSRLSVRPNASEFDTISEYGGVAVSPDGLSFYVLNLTAEAIMEVNARDLSLRGAFAVELFEDDDYYGYLDDGSLAVSADERLFAVGLNEGIAVVDRDFAEAAAVSRVFEVFTEDGSSEEDVALALQLGTTGDDALSGDDFTSSNFELFGGEGDDTLTGASSGDRLAGGAHDDRLEGLGGQDTLRGGRGDDVFVFGEDSGRDEIVDFEQGADLIDLSGSETIAGLNDLSIVRVGADVTISLTSRDSIKLIGFEGELVASDFVFASLPTEGADDLIGTDADDVIDGLGGDDTIEGGLGSDLLTGGAGDDVLYGDIA